MPQRISSPELPLLLAGVPQCVGRWLALAGVPTAAFRQRGTVSPLVRRGAGQIVLFDARSASSRFDARAAQDYALTAINVGAMLGARAHYDSTAMSRPNPQRLERALFFEELKHAIEEVGGLWARISDYPCPYRCAALDGTTAHNRDLAEIADAFAAMPQTVDDPADWLRRRYQAGLPIRWTGAPPVDGGTWFANRELPLLWRASVEEFARWWRTRTQINIRLRKDGADYRIVCDDFRGADRPMLELWRGSHLATIPLSPGETTIAQSGIAFQQEHDRRPAGFAALNAGETDRTEFVEPCGQAAG